eukprot:176025-Pelagomonas_calceolata.AAC.1
MRCVRNDALHSELNNLPSMEGEIKGRDQTRRRQEVGLRLKISLRQVEERNWEYKKMEKKY